MSREVILYDLPGREPYRSWSANVWKTRLALNFKSIPYRTEWVPYTQLQDKLKATGLNPNPPGSWAEYTVPVIQLADGSYLMDSAVIAIRLDDLYPEPSLHLNRSIEQESEAAISAVFVALAPYLAAIGISKLVAPEDAGWFKEDRASRFGTTIEELEKEKNPDDAYSAAGLGLEKCREVLTIYKKDDGPFILGSVPCYADFYLAATMQMFRRVGLDFFDRFLREAGPEMTAVHEACEKWMAKQD